jgi:hypothetical protein
MSDLSRRSQIDRPVGGHDEMPTGTLVEVVGMLDVGDEGVDVVVAVGAVVDVTPTVDVVVAVGAVVDVTPTVDVVVAVGAVVDVTPTVDVVVAVGAVAGVAGSAVDATVVAAVLVAVVVHAASAVAAAAASHQPKYRSRPLTSAVSQRVDIRADRERCSQERVRIRSRSDEPGISCRTMERTVTEPVLCVAAVPDGHSSQEHEEVPSCVAFVGPDPAPGVSLHTA